MLTSFSGSGRLINHSDQGWDSARAERNQSLDAILENLGLQQVPPTLHLMSSGSSLFGSQHSLPDVTADPEGDLQIPDPSSSNRSEKSKWKTLRDFVDEKAIEDALERMEEERTTLDVRKTHSSLNHFH